MKTQEWYLQGGPNKISKNDNTSQVYIATCACDRSAIFRFVAVEYSWLLQDDRTLGQNELRPSLGPMLDQCVKVYRQNTEM